MLNPTFLSFSWGGGNKQADAPDEKVESASYTDQGYRLAQNIIGPVHQLALLLTSGQEQEFFGIDWLTLAGLSGNQKDTAMVIVGILRERLRDKRNGPTPVTRDVKNAVSPVLQVSTR
jgi:hypothetical protein